MSDELENAVEYWQRRFDEVANERDSMEAGWANKWRVAVDMAARESLRADDLVQRVTWWKSLSASEMRLRCGELTPREIQAIRAVLNAILPDA